MTSVNTHSSPFTSLLKPRREAVGSRSPNRSSRIAAITLVAVMIFLSVLSFGFAIAAMATKEWIWLAGTLASGLTVIALSICSCTGCKVRQGNVLIGHQFDRLPQSEPFVKRKTGNSYTREVIPVETGNLLRSGDRYK